MLFADALIVYSVRAAIQLFRSHRARSWLFVKGEVTTSQQAKGSICRLAELTYSYRVDGELCTGTLEEPFLVSSPSVFADHYPPGAQIIVRVKPGNPETSFVREDDLYFQAHEYRLKS